MSKEATFRRHRVGMLVLFAAVPLVLLPSGCPGPTGAGTPEVPLSAGPFAVDQQDVTVSRADGSTFSAVLYSPVQDPTSSGSQERIAYPLPAITFGHAWFTPPDVYRSTLRQLASQGYFVIAARSGMEAFPNYRAFADDMSACLSWLESQTADATSSLYQQVDTARLGALGHSTGGGAAVLAASTDPRIRAIATLAAAETVPPASIAAPEIQVPILFVIATADSVTPPAQNALAIFAATHPPHLAILLEGATHCGFLDQYIMFCDAVTVPREVQLAETWSRLTAFFGLNLKGLSEAEEDLLSPTPLDGALPVTFLFDPP